MEYIAALSEQVSEQVLVKRIVDCNNQTSEFWWRSLLVAPIVGQTIG